LTPVPERPPRVQPQVGHGGRDQGQRLDQLRLLRGDQQGDRAAHRVAEQVHRPADGFDVPRDDGSVQKVYRCPECQVAVYSDYGRPEVLFVRGGTLDEPGAIEPDVHIFTKSKVGWVTIPESQAAVEIFYDREELWPAESLERLDAVRSRETAS